MFILFNDKYLNESYIYIYERENNLDDLNFIC